MQLDTGTGTGTGTGLDTGVGTGPGTGTSCEQELDRDLDVDLSMDMDMDLDLDLEELHDGNEMRLLLDILYDNNIVGDGSGEGDNNNAPILNDADDADDRDNNDDDDDDFEGNMVFDGDDYSVNFHRHINVENIRDLEFDGGAVRETVYRVHFNANWAGVKILMYHV